MHRNDIIFRHIFIFQVTFSFPRTAEAQEPQITFNGAMCEIVCTPINMKTVFDNLKFVLSLTLLTSFINTTEVKGQSKPEGNAVGVKLKSNGKVYFVSAGKCPDGIFLTRPVNENCLCFNGIFQIVRECCSVRNTTTAWSGSRDNLEFGVDFKCGTASSSRNPLPPIRGILPLTTSSSFAERSFIITPTSAGKWRAFDLEDVLTEGKSGQLDVEESEEFQVVNVKPLGGKMVRIRFGEASKMTVCYAGWNAGLSSGRQIVHVKVNTPGETGDCCFNLTQSSAGVITAPSGTGSVLVELVENGSKEKGNCPENAPNPWKPSPGEVSMEESFPETESRNIDDIPGGRRPILFKRYPGNTPSPGKNETNEVPEADVLPRKKGLSFDSLDDQARAINHFIAILRNDPSVGIRDPQTPRLKLLKKSLEIFLSLIPNDVVPHVMVQTAFDVFHFLFDEMDEFLIDPPEVFIETQSFLDKCLKTEETLKFVTISCPKQIDQLEITSRISSKLAKYYSHNSEDLRRALDSLRNMEIPKEKRLIPEKHDIYVEVNWKIFDFVHSFCFDHFGGDFKAHSYFEREMEALFSLAPVQKRWFTNRPSLKYVRGVFPVHDLQLSMKQLDKVTAYGHQLSRFNGSYWLERPVTPPLRQLSSSNFQTNSNFREKNKFNQVSHKFSAGLLDKDPSQINSDKTPGEFSAGEVIWDGIAVCL